MKNIIRVYRTHCKFVTRLNNVTVMNFNTWTVWNCVSLSFTCLVIGNCNFSLTLWFCYSNCTADFWDYSKTLWTSCLEKFLDTRKTLCNIAAWRNTAGVESTHCKLCTRFTDWLCGNNTNCLTDINKFTCSKVCTVTFSTNTNFWLTSKYASDIYFFDTGINNIISLYVCYKFTVLCKNFACFRVNNILHSCTADDTVI